MLDLEHGPREARPRPEAPGRRRRGRDRRRARLLPGLGQRLALVQLPRDPHAPRRRRRPAGAARCAPRGAQARRPLRAAEAARPPLAAEDDRSRHGAGQRGVPGPPRRPRAARLARDDRVGGRAGAGPPRGAADRVGASRARGARAGRGRGGVPGRRLARRPVGVLRREPVPDGRAPAAAGDLSGRPRGGPHADRRRLGRLAARRPPTRPRRSCAWTSARRARRLA